MAPRIEAGPRGRRYDSQKDDFRLVVGVGWNSEIPNDVSFSSEGGKDVTPGTKRLVWRKEAEAGLDPNRTSRESGDLLDSAVKKILKNLPAAD